ncbi:YhcH/YjgK/YiaL family protein [Clostridium paraputrificum]|uniref:YhcH/YjgK/YiaL family protein n=1 Tax=Clostridium paraputrificum TaxID=29363 RepID=UPI003D333538
MIIDNLINSENYYCINERFRKAFNYIREENIKELKGGRYDIEGSLIYAVIDEYETKDKRESSWEVHKKYIDIQYIISGEEQIGWMNANDINVSTDYNHERDILFGTGSGNFITVKQGEFMILMPQDAHMPCIKVDKKQYVKKVVIKIAIDK